MQAVVTKADNLTAQDIARIARAVLVRDPEAGSTYCRMCSVQQNAGLKPMHEPDCPMAKLLDERR